MSREYLAQHQKKSTSLLIIAARLAQDYKVINSGKPEAERGAPV
jgi:hypothetical protein